MALNYGITDNGALGNGKNIYAGLHAPIEMGNVVIASGQGELVRGTCLGLITATGKYKIWDTDADDGSEALVGILGQDIDATTEDRKTFMYVHGEFLADNLVAAHEVTAGVYNGGALVFKEAN